MNVSQETFSSFINLIEFPTEESLSEANEQILKFPEIAESFAQKSPKFVEIFSHLQPGATKGKIAVKFYQLISTIFTILIPKPDVFFSALNYLADTLIRRHLDFLIYLMSTKNSKIALHVLVQAASVHPTHCRDLYSAFDFSNQKFRKFISNENNIDEYIRLSTIFLNNNDVSTQFLATKYSLSPIWKSFSRVDFQIAKLFIDALIVATSKLNQSTKRWVFNDMTLKALSNYQITHADVDSAPHSMYILLKSLMEGNNSIIFEDPKRTYCFSHQDLDPAPKNSHILLFLKELKVWKLSSHRELATFIFKQSPDLIARYMITQQREITPVLDVTTMSTFLFLGKIIELDWPEFLYEDKDFFAEGRSLDYLFESILPSILKNSNINQFMKSSSPLHKQIIIKLLLKSVMKFIKLPDFLKTQDTYIKFRGRIPGNLPQFLNEVSSLKTVFPFALKLLVLLDRIFPFYISDSFTKEPPFIEKFASYSPIIQLEILKFIPLLQNPLKPLPFLCSLISSEENNSNHMNSIIKHKIYQTLLQIIEGSDAFLGFEYEIPIFLGETLREQKNKEFFELITLVKGNPLNYLKDGLMSPICNALIQKNENQIKQSNNQTQHPLFKNILLIKLMNSNSNVKEIDLSPVVTMSNIKWYALESATVLLCSAIAHNVTDLDLTLNCLTIVVTSNPQRTIKYILNHPFMRASIFNGSPTIDTIVSNYIIWNASLNNSGVNTMDEDIINSFLNGNIEPEVLDKIAPLIPSKYHKQLIRKLLHIRHSIRSVVVDKAAKYNLTDLKPFWKWAFKGFEALDLSKFWPRIIKKIDDELLLLDLLRTIYISKNSELINYISVSDETLYNITNQRLLVFLIVLIPSLNKIKLPNNLPVSFITESNVADPLFFFEKTHKTWCYQYLLQQIRKSPFQRKSANLEEDKVKFVIDFYLQFQSDSFLQTFETEMSHYLIMHPEVVKSPPKFTSTIFNIASKEILMPSKLVEYDISQYEGIANILLGSMNKISIRVVLFLATGLSGSPSFYNLIEYANISPSSFLFATGEVAKVVIQTLDSKQKIYPAGLCRNATYLAPFHLAHQTVEIDSPYFRFLLHFSHYLLTTEAVPLDTYMESGAPSIIFRSLSSKDQQTRNVGYASLSELYDLNMKKKDYSYHKQLQLLLESLINAVSSEGMRFTSLITYFLALASSIIIKPGHTIFYTLIKFLASDRALRCSSVPLFNDLFGQNSLEYRSERRWILKMLKNGVNESSDVELMKKGKVIERLCSFFSSPLSDMNSRKLILEILINASKYSRLDGIIIWAYSIMTEQFASPHLDQIVSLAFALRSKTEIEKECLLNIAHLAWEEHKDSLSDSKENIAKLINYTD